MTNSRREFLLKIAAVAVLGLLGLDHFVLTPATESWKAQSSRIADLQDKIQRGQQLIKHKDQIQRHWTEMLHTNLPPDHSSSESQAITAISRWAGDSRVMVSSLTLTPQWQTRDDGSEILEYHISAEGDQGSLGRFIYQMETDPLPVNLEECELALHDTKGSQLTLTARFTFLRLAAQAGGSAK